MLQKRNYRSGEKRLQMRGASDEKGRSVVLILREDLSRRGNEADEPFFTTPNYFEKTFPEWGNLVLIANEKGICRIELLAKKETTHKKVPSPSTHITHALEEIEQYLEGKRKTFSFSTDFTFGTSFQKKVWKTLQKIPYGECRTYQWLAGKIKNPNACQAVGQACGANPLPLIIPCHRIVAKGEKLGGFSAPLSWKKRLLKLEGITITS